MKNYLECSLTQEERDLITAIIWITAKDYKKRMYKRNRYVLLPIDDIELAIEDEYHFFYKKTRDDFDFIDPISSCDKIKIVEYIDNLLSELMLEEFRVALTFEEKLVLFLYFFKKYNQEKVAMIIGVSSKTINRRKKSIDNKIKLFLGGMWNV